MINKEKELTRCYIAIFILLLALTSMTIVVLETVKSNQKLSDKLSYMSEEPVYGESVYGSSRFVRINSRIDY